jgi:aldose 1-epimerase
MSFEIILDKEPLGTSVFMKDLESGCQVFVLSFGAILNGFAIPLQGEYINVIDGFMDNTEAYENIEKGFKGARMSPFAGRIKKGHYTFNGKDHKLEKFYLGANALHGLMYDHAYEIADYQKSAKEVFVKLKGFYAATDKGYPFSFLSEVTYRLQKGNKLVIETCVEHFNEQPIPYGEGWHPYFLLTRRVDDCSLFVNSSTRFVADKNVLCNGETVNDERFENATSLSGVVLDDCFELKKEHGKAAVLKDDYLQLTIDVIEGYKYLQVYTPDHRSSVALECISMLPDAFNHGIGLKILQPNKKYRFACSYTLEEA